MLTFSSDVSTGRVLRRDVYRPKTVAASLLNRKRNRTRAVYPSQFDADVGLTPNWKTTCSHACEKPVWIAP